LRERGHALVLGAAGFFGLALVRSLSASGVRVVASDRVPVAEFAPRAGTDDERVVYVARDLAREPVDDLIAGARGVVHAAALTLADEAAGDTAEQLLRVNLESLLHVVPAARAGGCERIVFISSAGVYDQGVEGTLTEEDADGGTSLYGATKLAGELVAGRYCAIAGLDFAALRPTSLFGAGETARPSRPRVTAFAQLVAAAERDDAVRLERGDARVDWLCVDDAADAVATLWAQDRLDGRVYNLSSGAPRRLRDVAAEVSAATGLRLDDRADTVVDGGADRPAVIDNGRIRAALGWQPLRTIADEAAALLRERAPAPGGRR